MKCYSHTTRGIAVANNALSSLKPPVILSESLLKAPNATFVDRLVFADAEVKDDTIFLHAQASENDERALVFTSVSESFTADEETISFQFHAVQAVVEFSKRELGGGYCGYYSDTQQMVLVIEPGGHVGVETKRISQTKPGFWAGIFGAKPVTHEIIRQIEIRYDGTEVTYQTVLEQRREIVRLVPGTKALHALTARGV